MKNINFKKALLFLTVLLTVHLGCNNKNKVDNFLDEYENVVVKWEQKAKKGNLTFQDFSEINAETLKLAEKEEQLKDKSVKNITPEQQEHLYKLMTRLTEVTTKITNN